MKSVSAALAAILIAWSSAVVPAQEPAVPETYRVHTRLFTTKTDSAGEVKRYKPFKTKKNFQIQVDVALYKSISPDAEADGNDAYLNPNGGQWIESLIIVADSRNPTASSDPMLGMYSEPAALKSSMDLMIGASMPLPEDFDPNQAYFTTKLTTFKKNGEVAKEFSESPRQPLGGGVESAAAQAFMSGSDDTISTLQDLGVGTLTPEAKLHVVGDVKVEGRLTVDSITLPDGSVMANGARPVVAHVTVEESTEAPATWSSLAEVTVTPTGTGTIVVQADVGLAYEIRNNAAVVSIAIGRQPKEPVGPPVLGGSTMHAPGNDVKIDGFDVLTTQWVETVTAEMVGKPQTYRLLGQGVDVDAPATTRFTLRHLTAMALPD